MYQYSFCSADGLEQHEKSSANGQGRPGPPAGSEQPREASTWLQRLVARQRERACSTLAGSDILSLEGPSYVGIAWRSHGDLTWLGS